MTVDLDEEDLDRGIADAIHAAEEKRRNMSDSKSDTSPPPKPPETQPELPETQPETAPEMSDEAREAIGIATAMATEALKSMGVGFGKMWSSLCLIGPSLARIATAHETLTVEAKIFNEAYAHDVGQKHHAMAR